MLDVALNTGNWMGSGGAQPKDVSSILRCGSWVVLMALYAAAALSDMLVIVCLDLLSGLLWRNSASLLEANSSFLTT